MKRTLWGWPNRQKFLRTRSESECINIKNKRCILLMTTNGELIVIPGNSNSIWVRACNIVTVRLFAPHCISVIALKNNRRPSFRVRALPCLYNIRVMNVGVNPATSRTMWLRPISGLKHTLPTSRYGQYFTHAHNHITRAVPFMDMWLYIYWEIVNFIFSSFICHIIHLVCTI